MDNQYSLLSLIGNVLKWRIKILQFLIVVAIGSTIVSFVIPVYYKSNTTFYAASPDLANPMPLGTGTREYYIYGTNDDLDRLFSIANSNQMVNFLIDSFQLHDHYKIKKTDPKALYKIQTKLEKLFKTSKTKYSAMSLSVEDKDPIFAANMANKSREYINELAQNMIKESQAKLIESFEENIREKEKIAEVISDSLTKLKKQFDIVDTRSQSEIFAELLAKNSSELEETRSKLQEMKNIGMKKDSIIKYEVKLRSLDTKVEQIRSDITTFNSGISEVRKVELEYARLIDQISLDKERVKQIKATYAAPFTAIHVVETAQPSVVKSRPKRLLIVAGACLAALIFSIFGVIAIENTRHIEWKNLWNAPVQ